jgi:DNA invertase Pin-like site-specific DNA recombinase
MPTPIRPARVYVAALGYERIIPALNAAAEKYGWAFTATYVEEDAGQTLIRPELMRLLREVQRGDVLLVDQIKRLGRVKAKDWQELRRVVVEKELRLVALDVPSSFPSIVQAWNATNDLLLDVLGAVNSRQHEDRLRKAKEGIDKAKEAGVYKGRVPDAALHDRIKLLLAEGVPIRKIATACECAKSTVQAVKAGMMFAS